MPVPVPAGATDWDGSYRLGSTLAAALCLQGGRGGGSTHQLCAPEPPRLKANIQGDFVRAGCECWEVFPKVIAVGNVYL